MAIKAIQTRYAGRHFRSRLEARWAVFFDSLAIEWRYEPEGFQIHDRLGIADREGWGYLPDFLLPSGITPIWPHPLWVEVKGYLDNPAMRRVLSTAAYLSSPDGGCRDNGGIDTLLLGDIPRPWGIHHVTMPWVLHLHKGDLHIASLGSDTCYGGTLIADDGGWLHPHLTPEFLLGGFCLGSEPSPETVGRVTMTMFRQAYHRAREARFEHGQTYASRVPPVEPCFRK